MRHLNGGVILLLALQCAAENTNGDANARRFSVREEAAAGSGSPRVLVMRDHEAGLEAAVAPGEGGELSSFQVRHKGEWIELIYRARDYTADSGWRGKAPLLWPAVGGQYHPGTIPAGSCVDGTYATGGKDYPMPCHGFARALAWKQVFQRADDRGARVAVELADSVATRSYYPFGFRITASYDLSQGALGITYTVSAASENHRPMIFSIGNHVTFRVPFVNGTDPGAMLFETPSSMEMLRDRRGLLTGEHRPRSFASPVRLDEFSAVPAVPLGGYSEVARMRLTDPQGLGIQMSHSASSLPADPLVRFNVWGGPKQGYFSPEPWVGLQNSLNTMRGLVSLAPGGRWTWTIDIRPEVRQEAGVEKLEGGFGFTEGPVWSRQGYLIFSDIPNQRILTLKGSGPAKVLRDKSNAANGNALDSKGRLYSCERDGRRVVRAERDGRIMVIADQWQGMKLNSPNDVVVRKDGHVYFTDPASRAVLEKQEIGFNGVYHVSPDGRIRLVSKSIARPNGITLSPDGRTLYVSDTERRTIVGFSLDRKGNASGERIVVSGIDGGPDGLRVDKKGNIYVACRAIAVYSPDGKLLQTIPFPERPTNCAFGGADLRTLYVTAQTSVYKVRTPEKGSLQY